MDFNTTTDQYGDTSRFISLFNELDDYMGTRLCQEHGSWSDMNHIPFMDKLRELTGYQVIRAEHLHELREMAQLRNAILHGYGKAPGVNPKVIAIPLKTTVDRFEEICRVIMNPPKVYPAISVPLHTMAATTLDQSLQSVVNRVIAGNFSYIPVLENGRLIGVFSQETLFNMLADQDEYILEKELPLRDFETYIKSEKHVNESFGFIPKSLSISEAEAEFAAGRPNQRLEVLFITENGNSAEKLLGMTTLWDLMNYRAEKKGLF